MFVIQPFCASTNTQSRILTIGKRLVEKTLGVLASSFLFQRISVVLQRFNSVLLHDGFIDDDRPE